MLVREENSSTDKLNHWPFSVFFLHLLVHFLFMKELVTVA